MNSELIGSVEPNERLGQPSTRKRRYLAMLEQRIASSKEHLSKVLSLAEAWDFELDGGAQIGMPYLYSVDSTDFEQTIATDDELRELRPLLAVDKTELEHDIARLLRQIALLKA